MAVRKGKQEQFECRKEIHIPEKPRYKLGDDVIFYFNRGYGGYSRHRGKIVVVDSYGSLECYMKQPSYDIETYEENGWCIYKHIQESDIIQKHN